MDGHLPLNWSERERWQWVVDITGSHSFIITFSYSLDLQLWRLCWILNGWLIKFSVQPFKSLFVIYRMGNIGYHHWGCPSIYRPSLAVSDINRYKTKLNTKKVDVKYIFLLCQISVPGKNSLAQPNFSIWILFQKPSY